MMGKQRGDKADPAPEEAVLKYKTTRKDEDGPSKDRFQPDFSEKRPETSQWNIRLAEVFQNDYVQKGQPVGEVKDVTKYFLTYLGTLQSTRRKMTTNATTGTGSVHDNASRRNRIEKRKRSVRSTPI
jgi:hypothetical protein